jgi:hypothetical protein
MNKEQGCILAVILPIIYAAWFLTIVGVVWLLWNLTMPAVWTASFWQIGGVMLLLKIVSLYVRAPAKR